MVRFRILERISIRSYIFVIVGTVERPFPVKAHHRRGFCGARVYPAPNLSGLFQLPKSNDTFSIENDFDIVSF